MIVKKSKGFFGKNKKGSKKQSNSDESNDVARGSRRQKDSGSEFAKVLQTSVFSTIERDFLGNEKFITNFKNEDAYVGLLLRSEDIGGINEKGNADKGMIIQSFNAATITAYISEPLLASDDAVIIIPTSDTVETMMEFSLLRAIAYELVIVLPGGDLDTRCIVVPDTRIKLKDLKDIHASADNDDIAIMEYIKGVDGVNYRNGNGVPSLSQPQNTNTDDVMNNSYDNANELPSDETYDEPTSNDSNYVMPIQQYDDVDNGFEDEYQTNEPYDDEPYDDEPEFSDDEPYDDDEYDESDDNEQPLIVGDDEADTIYAKVYTRGDISLTIDTTSFDSLYNPTTTDHRFDIDGYNDEGIDAQLKALAIKGNNELINAKRRFIEQQRHEFIRVLEGTLSKLLPLCDINNDNCIGKSELEAILSRYDSDLETAKDVASLCSDITDAYEKGKQEYIESETKVLGTKYDKQHRDAFEMHKASVVRCCKTSAEDSKNKKIHELTTKLENKMNAIKEEVESKTLLILSTKHSEYLKQEDELVNKYIDAMEKARMDGAIAENTRIETLRADLERNNREADIKKDHEIAMRRVREEFETKAEHAKSEFDRVRDIDSNMMERIQKQNEELLKNASEAERLYKDRITELNDKNKDLGVIKDSEYAVKIENITASFDRERNDNNNKYDELARSQKRANTIILIAVLLVGMATASVGYIAGSASNKGSETQQPVLQYMTPAYTMPIYDNTKLEAVEVEVEDDDILDTDVLVEEELDTDVEVEEAEYETDETDEGK